MIETALVAGFTSVGMDVLLLGPMPTPAVAMLTRSMRADLGVMISASHNAYEDNGIKLFDPDGFKLSDETELEIEALIDGNLNERLAASASLGRAKRIESVHARYIEFAKRTLPRTMDLDGLRIVIDCANGAAYKVAPEALWELGPKCFRLALNPMVSTLTAMSALPRLMPSSIKYAKCAPISALRLMAMRTASSLSMKKARWLMATS